METMNNFLKRRSVNFFKKDYPLPKTVLKNIINLAGMSPSSSNTQPWQLIVVEDSEAKKRLRKAAFDQPKITDASATLILLGDPQAYKAENPTYQSFVERGYMDEAGLKDFTDMVENLYENLETPDRFAAKNSALYGMSLMYAAEAYGWQTHPMIGFNPEEVKKQFKIPEELLITMLISIGKFDDEKDLLPRNRRKSFTDIVSIDSYQKNKQLNLANPFVESQKKLTMQGEELELAGIQPEIGEQAVDFTVLDGELNPVSLKEMLKAPLVISTVPSLDTPVCHQQTKNFSETLESFKQQINFVTISCDTPFAQNRFKEAENINWPIYSDINGREFSTRYGLLVKQLGLTARSVLILDKTAVIRYFQIVEELSEQPDYDDVISFLKSTF